MQDSRDPIHGYGLAASAKKAKAEQGGARRAGAERGEAERWRIAQVSAGGYYVSRTNQLLDTMLKRPTVYETKKKD